MERMRPSPVYMTRFATLKSESKHRLGAQKSTSTSPWYTRCPGCLNVCMPIRHQVESGAAFSADTGSPNRHCGREGRPPGGYTASECRSRAFLLDIAYADSQAVGHMRCVQAAPTDRDVLAASEDEAPKRSHCARLGQVSFDERSYKLSALAVERFRRLGKEGSGLIDQVAARIFGGTNGPSFARKGVCKERFC